MKSTQSQNSNTGPTNYKFGEKIIPSSQVIIARKHVYAMVALRAMVPGHVIVCPSRVVQHFRDLTELETLEVFICAKEIAKKFEDYFKIKSFSFIMQDGDNAGQSTKHAHLHVIPRDESSDQELKYVKFDSAVERNVNDMIQEAETLRQIFEKRSDIAQFNQSNYL